MFRVSCVTEGRLFSVGKVAWVRGGTVPQRVYSRHPGTSRECCPALPSPVSTPSRQPCTTMDSSNFILPDRQRSETRGLVTDERVGLFYIDILTD